MDEALKHKLAEVSQTTAGDEVNKVVNNLAAKIGVAVDKVTPVADKVVQEITIRGFAMAIVWLLLAIVVATVCWVLVRRMYNICGGRLWNTSGPGSDPPSGWGWPIMLFTAIGVGFSIFSIYNIVVYINQAAAPTLYLLEVLFSAGSGK